MLRWSIYFHFIFIFFYYYYLSSTLIYSNVFHSKNTFPHKLRVASMLWSISSIMLFILSPFIYIYLPPSLLPFPLTFLFTMVLRKKAFLATANNRIVIFARSASVIGSYSFFTAHVMYRTHQKKRILKNYFLTTHTAILLSAYTIYHILHHGSHRGVSLPIAFAFFPMLTGMREV